MRKYKLTMLHYAKLLYCINIQHTEIVRYKMYTTRYTVCRAIIRYQHLKHRNTIF